MGKGDDAEAHRPLLAPSANTTMQTTSGAFDPRADSRTAQSRAAQGSDILGILRREGLDITDEFTVDKIFCRSEHSAGFKVAKGVATAGLGLTVVGAFYAVGKAVLIKRGNVGLAMNNGVPELLAPGWHLLLSPFRKFVKQVPISTERVHHGTINIVTVREGFVGLVLDRGTPILLPPGMHQWDSETKVFVDVFDLSKPVIRLGPYTLLIVHDGTVGVTHDNGRLDIRAAGYHVLKHERHLFYCELDVTDQFDELNDLDLITRDNVPVNVDCTVHFKLCDPDTAALEAGKMPEVRKLVMREARAAMASSVLQSTVSDLELLASSSQGAGTGEEDLLGDASVASGLAASEETPGKGQVNYDGRDNQFRRGQYLAKAQASMRGIGVNLIKIAIRKIKILDPQITKKLAQQASIRVTRLEKLDTAEVESRTVDIDAKARAKAEITHAEAQAQRVRIMAEARLYEAKKIQQAAELLDQNRTARVLAELSGMTDVLKHTSTNTVFIGGGGGDSANGAATDVTSALIGNPNFTQMPPAKNKKAHLENGDQPNGASDFHGPPRPADDYTIA